MEKKTYILITVVSFIIVLALIIIPKNPVNINTISIGNINHTLKKGDFIYVNSWDELEVIFNNKEYQEIPFLYKGITIGSTKEEVIEEFDIKKGYANINMEVKDKREDGTTEVIDILYENKKSFDYEFLDANISFGYKKENNKWKMLKYKELEKYFNEDGEIKTKDDILYFEIDINGMSEENVEKDQVIKMIVRYV